VRDLVGLGVHLARTVDEGTIPGPHIYGGGAMLSPTAGHGDLHMFPTSYLRTLEAGGHYIQLCDGVAECLRGVRNQLRLGARVIKVCASGGVMSETDHPIHQQFSEEELRVIVEEAGRAERIVAAHCHGKPGIMAALRAGCGTIEHGSYLDEESVDLLIEKKATLVPTRYILERLVTLGPKMNVPDYAYRKVVELVDHHKRSLQLAIRKGVRIALGTDIWSSGDGTTLDLSAVLEFLEEELRVIVGDTQDRGDFASRPTPASFEEVQDRFHCRVDPLTLDPRIDLAKDILEHFPRLPSIETRGEFSPADRERRESADLEPFAFGSVRLEGGLRAAVLQGCREFGDIEPDFAGDFRLYRFPMDRSSVETPSLAQGP